MLNAAFAASTDNTLAEKWFYEAVAVLGEKYGVEITVTLLKRIV